jgi:predicted ATPase
MQVNLTIKNYRCFSDEAPVRIPLRKGFTGLIGVNNSGKSTLLKFFFEFRSLFQILSSPHGNFPTTLQGNQLAFGPARTILDLTEIFNNTNNRSLEVQVNFDPEPQDPERRPFRLVIRVPRDSNSFQTDFYLENQLIRQGVGITPETMTLTLGGNPLVHIPSFFETFSTLAKTLYIGPFRNAVNVGTNADYFDIPIGQSFVGAWRENKTGPRKKQNEATYRLTQDIKRIFGYRELEINSSPDGQTLQFFIDGKSYLLAELGSGISHFILVLAAAATRQPSYILIDEPELNLHPSLQLDFLTTLASYATEGVIFSTHSVGLARAAADRIYSVRKGDNGNSQVTPMEKTLRLPEFLGELSFSGYQELGFDKILLVEGASDVKTIQQFLRKYGLDHKVVLLPLGGSQLINGGREAELLEIKRISNNVFALIDSERTVAGEALRPDRLAFVQSCKKVAIACTVLERRAIENYFTERAVRSFKGNTFRALTPYELLRAVSPAWSKEENWRIASEMTKEELEATELGGFLKSL